MSASTTMRLSSGTVEFKNTAARERFNEVLKASNRKTAPVSKRKK